MYSDTSSNSKEYQMTTSQPIVKPAAKSKDYDALFSLDLITQRKTIGKPLKPKTNEGAKLKRRKMLNSYPRMLKIMKLLPSQKHRST